MENFWQRSTGNSGRGSLKQRLDKIEEELSLGEMKRITAEEQHAFKFPFKWKRSFRKSNGKLARDKVLVFWFNTKGEIEPPFLVPLFSGSIVIYANKAYEFDPRALYTIKLPRGKMCKVLAVNEYNRRPISNLDWDEVKRRGDATDSDEILVKMVTKAVIEKTKKKVAGMGIIIVIGLIIAAAVVLFFFMK